MSKLSPSPPSQAAMPSTPNPGASISGTAAGSAPTPTPAKPPSRSEIERKLSFRSAKKPSDSPRKKRTTSSVSGNDSDTSLSSSHGGALHPSSASASGQFNTSPLLSPNLTGPGNPAASAPAPGGIAAGGVNASGSGSGGLSAIAERLGLGPGEEVEEYEEHDVDGEGDGSGSEDEAETKERQGELERGMEGERVLRSGYLYKKQEKRKVWKKKWFVLRTGKLAYYKDDREYSLSRVLDLKTIHTAAPVKIKKHSFTFGIVTKKRTFLCEASSQGEMDEWVAAIVNARKRLTEDGERRERQGSLARAGANPANAPEAPGNSVLHGTSPMANTSYFTRSPMSASPAQMHPTTGLPGVVNPAANTAPRQGPAQEANLATHSSTASGQLAPASAKIGVRASQGASTSAPAAGSGILGGPPATQPQGFRGGSNIRREPSASSVSSAGIGPGMGADYFPRTPSAGHGSMTGSLPRNAGGLSPQLGGLSGLSSDSEDGEADEGGRYFSNIGLRMSEPQSLPQAEGQVQPERQGSIGRAPSLSLNMPSPAFPAQVDPSRVILSSYLMKRSKGRGRKVWRKRWFILTSQGLTYTKSHMDTKAVRQIPLSSILDAIDQSSTLDDVDPTSSDSDNARPSRPARSGSVLATSSSSKHPSPPQRQLTALMHPTQHLGAHSGPSSGPAGGEGGEHTFRLVTAKRNYTLCAPSEEDEIKWLAAFKALLNRERGLGSPVTETAPRLFPVNSPPPAATAQGQGYAGAIPTFTQQPPTPGTGLMSGIQPNRDVPNPLAPALSTDIAPSSGQDHAASETPASPTSAGSPTSPTSPITLGGRGRSATYTAKHAVAEVVRRFHPEQSHQGQAQGHDAIGGQGAPRTATTVVQ